MGYRQLILEMFYDLLEKGFDPAGVNYICFTEFLEQKTVDLEDVKILWDMALDIVSESAFHGFLMGFNYARILFTGTGKLIFPQPDDYETLIHPLMEKSDFEERNTQYGNDK